MPGQKAQKNQDLITGRIAYGYDGTDTWPVKANTTDVSSSAAVLSVDVVPVKTIETELVAQTAIAASAQLVSTVFSLVGIKKVNVFIDHARAGSAAFTVQGTEYRVEGSQKASGNDTWRSIVSVVASSAVAQTCAASGGYAAGAGTITILSGTALVLGDTYYWLNGAAASSEWMKVTALTGTASFNILDGLTNAQAAASAIVGKAEQWVLVLDVEALTRMRVIVNNNASATTQAIYSRVAVITEK